MSIETVESPPAGRRLEPIVSAVMTPQTVADWIANVPSWQVNQMMILLNGYGIALTLEMGRSLSLLERQTFRDRCGKEMSDETQPAPETLGKIWGLIEEFAGENQSR